MEVVERTYAIVNPSIRRGAGSFPTLTDDELQGVLARADWRERSPERRGGPMS